MKKNIPKSKRYKPPKPKRYRWVTTRTGRLGLEEIRCLKKKLQ